MDLMVIGLWNLARRRWAWWFWLDGDELDGDGLGCGEVIVGLDGGVVLGLDLGGSRGWTWSRWAWWPHWDQGSPHVWEVVERAEQEILWGYSFRLLIVVVRLGFRVQRSIGDEAGLSHSGGANAGNCLQRGSRFWASKSGFVIALQPQTEEIRLVWAGFIGWDSIATANYLE